MNGAERLHPRFIVTNLSGEPRALYDGLYCQRGEAENRIKEAQVGLFVTRTSCHVLRSKPLRMLLTAMANQPTVGKISGLRTCESKTKTGPPFEAAKPKGMGIIKHRVRSQVPLKTS